MRCMRLPAPLLLALAVLLSFGLPAQAQPLPGAPLSFADLAERLLPSVVNISTTQQGPIDPRTEGNLDLEEAPPGIQEFLEEFFERQQQNRGSTLGTGFVIDAERGLVVTNNHVLAKPENVLITFNDETQVEVEVVGTDRQTDLAVLRIKDMSDLGDYQLTALPWGDSDAMRVGDWVIAIGNPFGLGGTVTAGIVSARGRNINSGRYDDFLQIDAPINRGNSGGPTFNLQGEVIGINTAIFSPGSSGGSVGIGFAIPSNLARKVVNQLVEFGRTRRGWLGVNIQDIDLEIAESLGLDEARGVLVTDLNEHGPAKAGGMQPGDLILAFNGVNVDTVRDLTRIVAETLPETESDVLILRDGERMTLALTLGELEEAEEKGWLSSSEEPSGDTPGAEEPPASRLFEALGLELSDLSDALREEYEIPASLEGVVVLTIVPEGPAAGELEVGDVITQISQITITDLLDAEEAVERMVDLASRPSVLLRVIRRGGDPIFVPVPLQR